LLLSEYDFSAIDVDLRREFGIPEPDLGVDWEEDVHSGKVQLKDGFVEFDPVWGLVAHGEVKDGRCGKFMRRKVKKLMGCLRVHLHDVTTLDGVNHSGKVHIERVFYSCNRPECPSCGVTAWAVREAKRAELRLNFVAGKLGLRAEHVIHSPPQNLKVPFKVLREMARKSALSRGIIGGLWIYHHFRYHGKDETYVGEPAHFFVSPHFHILGFIKGGYGNCRHCSNNCHGDFVFDRDKCLNHCNGFEGVTRRAYEKDGFITKVKGERKTIGGTVWYQLSHASIMRDVKKKVVVNWFGVCARNKMRLPKGKLPQKEHLCKICRQPLYEVKYLGSYRDLLSYMGCFKDSEGFELDAKDKNGEWLWRVVPYRKRVRCNG
jgi:hypothetical protein